MSREDLYPYEAGQLLQLALNPRSRPVENSEYRRLVNAYLDDGAFHQVVQQVAAGLGLEILEASGHGLVLGPSDSDSTFAMGPDDYREAIPGNRTNADDRLIQGLIQLAIASLVFPRPEDLEEADAEIARPPVTVEEVEERLRSICDTLRRTYEEEGADMPAENIAKRLYPAWHAYDSRIPDQDSENGRRSPRGTLRSIESGFGFLVRRGLFASSPEVEGAYQPLYAYQVQVAHGGVRRMLEVITRLEDHQPTHVSEP